ncbi:DUF2784 domain-containing protein [Duganella sp. Root1480D1]|uniref:DUF2784 domain-containing protein n=1 Tax=Duganella sp. Root1480D1 TaxID=1736471 RepID=UPI00070B84A9|nr:DUF2784 domain-containing protein [Duganella sp. Root1480D1]KQZ27780.1 hypothetical protein ASD58_14420 [Duganella sp. Root1480D1]
MLFRLAGDAVLLLHLAFILFALCGAVLALRWPRVVRLHLPAALWAAGIELTGAICPLTYLENDLRMRAGQQGYADGFIEHYLLPVLYPAGLTPAVQYVLASVVLGVNLLLYGWLWLRRSARR